MIRRIALAVLLLPGCLPPTARPAATRPTRCVEDDYSRERLRDVATIFRSGEYLETRRSFGIRTVHRGAPMAVIITRKTCERLAEATRKALHAIYPGEVSLDGKELHVFRIGDYYAVLPVPDERTQAHAEVVITGRTDLLIFRRDTLEYLGYVLM
jgi:hypothetical protein